MNKKHLPICLHTICDLIKLTHFLAECVKLKTNVHQDVFIVPIRITGNSEIFLFSNFYQILLSVQINSNNNSNTNNRKRITSCHFLLLLSCINIFPRNSSVFNAPCFMFNHKIPMSRFVRQGYTNQRPRIYTRTHVLYMHTHMSAYTYGLQSPKSFDVEVCVN